MSSLKLNFSLKYWWTEFGIYQALAAFITLLTFFIAFNVIDDRSEKVAAGAFAVFANVVIGALAVNRQAFVGAAIIAAAAAAGSLIFIFTTQITACAPINIIVIIAIAAVSTAAVVKHITEEINLGQITFWFFCLIEFLVIFIPMLATTL